MNLVENPAALKKFRRTEWKFQQTFETPLKDLKRFVSTIDQAAGPWRSASITIELAVFDPTRLIDLMNATSISPRYQRGVSIIAVGQEESKALLEAALGDWLDFIFVPEPKSFAIYADHDEFTTFFAQNRSNLNRVVQSLSAQGFKLEREYRRKL
jgi:exonuclease VII small subunit